MTTEEQRALCHASNNTLNWHPNNQLQHAMNETACDAIGAHNTNQSDVVGIAAVVAILLIAVWIVLRSSRGF